jgi:hypothetical protein
MQSRAPPVRKLFQLYPPRYSIIKLKGVQGVYLNSGSCLENSRLMVSLCIRQLQFVPNAYPKGCSNIL